MKKCYFDYVVTQEGDVNKASFITYTCNHSDILNLLLNVFERLLDKSVDICLSLMQVPFLNCISVS